MTPDNIENYKLSWSGFTIYGDRKSLDEVKWLISVEARCRDLEAILKAQK